MDSFRPNTVNTLRLVAGLQSNISIGAIYLLRVQCAR